MIPSEAQLSAAYYLKIIHNIPIDQHFQIYGGIHADGLDVEWYSSAIPKPSIAQLESLLTLAQEWADQRQDRIRKKSVESLPVVSSNSTGYATALSMNLIIREAALIDVRGSAIFFGDAVANRIGLCRLRLMPGSIRIGSEFEIDSEGKIAVCFSEMIRLDPDTYQLQFQQRSSNNDYNVNLKNMHLAAYLLRDS